MGFSSLGLSCVFVQGLLFPGYAYGIPALRAIPSSPFERENHLRIAHAVTEAEPIEILLDMFSTDRHSLTVPQLVDISIPSTIPFDCAPGFVVLPNIVCLRVGARVPFCSSTTTRTSSIHSITLRFFKRFPIRFLDFLFDIVVPCLPLSKNPLQGE